MPGIVAFLSAKDIPGKNSFIPVGLLFMFEDEEVCVFCRHVAVTPKTNDRTDIGMPEWNEFGTQEALSQVFCYDERKRQNRIHF
jgi:hypothetical protein